MRLFRQIYRVTLPSGTRRLHAVLVEASLTGEARLVALETIRASNPNAEIELHGNPQLLELPMHWVIRDEVD